MCTGQFQSTKDSNIKGKTTINNGVGWSRVTTNLKPFFYSGSGLTAINYFIAMSGNNINGGATTPLWAYIKPILETDPIYLDEEAGVIAVGTTGIGFFIQTASLE